MYKNIFIMAWPAFIELTLTQLTSMVDLAMIGKLGPWALSAVGFSTQPKMIILSVFIAVNTGATALIARYCGTREPDKVNRVFNQSIILNIVMSLILAVAGYILSEPMVIAMGAEEEKIISGAVDYLHIQMVGMVFLALSTTITACLRGVGNSKTAMMYNLVANVVNVIFNYLLIYGKYGFPEMGVMGASLATVIGQVVACGVAIGYIVKTKRHFTLKLSMKIDMAITKMILKVGGPAMAEQVAMRIGMIIYAAMIARLGTIENATHQVCMNILGFSFMLGQAFAVSATTMVGRKLGENKPKEAEQYGICSTVMAIFISILIAVGFLIFNKDIMALFSDDTSVITMGASVIILLGFVQPIQAVQFTLTGALRGAGDTMFAAVISLITIVGVRIATGYLFMYVMDLGLIGGWYALVTDQIIRTTAICVRYAGGKWKSVLNFSK